MAAVAHSPAFAKQVGIPQSVGADYYAADQRKKMAEGGGTDSIKSTPRSAGVGALSDVLRWVRDAANTGGQTAAEYLTPAGRAGVPQLGLGDLMLGQAPEELNEWSYGNAPLRVSAAEFPGIGTYVPQFKRGRAESTLDTLFAAQPGVAAAKGAARAGEGALNAVARAAVAHNPFPAAPLRTRPAASWSPVGRPRTAPLTAEEQATQDAVLAQLLAAQPTMPPLNTTIPPLSPRVEEGFTHGGAVVPKFSKRAALVARLA